MNTTTSTNILPIIVNIREAAALNEHFPAVITAGPERYEVMWGHPNHLVQSFNDVNDGPHAPTIADVEAMLEFAQQNQEDILIHCHAGMSRSTATAWGVAIQRGHNPYAAYQALKDVHPEGRMFWPNDAIVAALESIFDMRGLSEYNDEHHYSGGETYDLF